MLLEWRRRRCFLPAGAPSLCRDGNHPRLLGENPGERDLRGCRLLPFGDLAEQIHQGLIRSAVFRLEARDDITKIGFIELRFFIDLAREEPFS